MRRTEPGTKTGQASRSRTKTIPGALDVPGPWEGLVTVLGVEDGPGRDRVPLLRPRVQNGPSSCRNRPVDQTYLCDDFTPSCDTPRGGISGWTSALASTGPRCPHASLRSPESHSPSRREPFPGPVGPLLVPSEFVPRKGLAFQPHEVSRI